MNKAQLLGHAIDAAKWLQDARMAENGNIVIGDHEIDVEEDRTGRRLVLTGLIGATLWPYRRMDETPCRITVDPERGARNVARAISHRLLPDHRALIDTLTKRKDISDAARARKMNAVKELIEQFPTLTLAASQDDRGEINLYGNRVRVTVWSETQIRVDVNADAPLAKALLRAVYPQGGQT